jgi:hypothetical protein
LYGAGSFLYNPHLDPHHRLAVSENKRSGWPLDESMAGINRQLWIPITCWHEIPSNLCPGGLLGLNERLLIGPFCNKYPKDTQAGCGITGLSRRRAKSNGLSERVMASSVVTVQLHRGLYLYMFFGLKRARRISSLDLGQVQI